MRHNVAGKLWGRTANQRKALLRGLAASLLEHQRIETTIIKAKEIRKHVERLVTLARRGGLHAKRIAMRELPNRPLVIKLFDEIAPRFVGRNGGYLRIVHTRRRVNDGAQMAIIEFVDHEEIKVKKEAGKKAEKKEKKSNKEENKKEGNK